MLKQFKGSKTYYQRVLKQTIIYQVFNYTVHFHKSKQLLNVKSLKFKTAYTLLPRSSTALNLRQVQELTDLSF